MADTSVSTPVPAPVTQEQKKLRVVAFNGSAKKSGNTHKLIQWVFEELNKEGVETEEINIGNQLVSGCIGCRQCKGKLACFKKNDNINEWMQVWFLSLSLYLNLPKTKKLENTQC